MISFPQFAANSTKTTLSIKTYFHTKLYKRIKHGLLTSKTPNKTPYMCVTVGKFQWTYLLRK